MMLDFDYDAERVREDIRRRARTVGTAAARASLAQRRVREDIRRRARTAAARASLAQCPECECVFDLADDDDAAE